MVQTFLAAVNEVRSCTFLHLNNKNNNCAGRNATLGELIIVTIEARYTFFLELGHVSLVYGVGIVSKVRQKLYIFVKKI